MLRIGLRMHRKSSVPRLPLLPRLPLAPARLSPKPMRLSTVLDVCPNLILELPSAQVHRCSVVLQSTKPAEPLQAKKPEYLCPVCRYYGEEIVALSSARWIRVRRRLEDTEWSDNVSD